MSVGALVSPRLGGLGTQISFWSWQQWDPWSCMGPSGKGGIQEVIAGAFVYGCAFMWVYQDLFL
jgi:hypothetical protein